MPEAQSSRITNGDAATDPVGSVQRQLFLRSLGADRTGPSLIAILAKHIKDRYVPAGDVLFAEGAPPVSIFFVLKGDVELRLEGHEPWVMTPPAVVGAFDALHERPHTRTAVAVTDLHMLMLSSEEWFDAIEENFEVQRDNMSRVAEGTIRLEMEIIPDGSFPEPEPIGEPAVGLNLVERILLLKRSLAFRAATVQALARVAEAAEEVEIPNGHVLHVANEPTESFYLVASGMIEITHENPPLIARFGAGQVVYGAAGVGLLKPAFDAKATSPSVLLEVKREDFFDVMEDHFEVTRSVMKGVSTERERALTERAERRGQTRSSGIPDAETDMSRALR